MRQGVKHNIKGNKSYYLTLTIVDWVDLFTRKSMRDIFISSLQYCILNKGLNIYAYCIMSNHVHLIVNSNEPFVLSDTIRDLKKFTSKAFIEEISNGIESRREWLLKYFAEKGKLEPKNKTYKVWKNGNHAIEVYGMDFTWEKINYIHNNPVVAGLVDNPWDWRYSSARNYVEQGEQLLPEVIRISPAMKTVR